MTAGFICDLEIEFSAFRYFEVRSKLFVCFRIPEPSSSTRIFKYTVRAMIVAAMSWSVFKFVKWVGAC